MFAQAESEELLHLLSQVRLVADEEARNEQEQLEQQQHRPSLNGERTIPLYTPADGAIVGALGKQISIGSSASIASGGGGSAAGRYTASSTAATTSSWTVHDNTRSTFGSNTAAASSSFIVDYEHHHPSPLDQPAMSRTPATNVKVLLHRSDERARGIKEDLANGGDGYSVFRQPKQLLFTSPSAVTQSATAQQHLQQQTLTTHTAHARQPTSPSHAFTVYTTSISTATRTMVPHSIDNATPILPAAVERDGSGYAKRDGATVNEGDLTGILHIEAVMRNKGGGGDSKEGFGRAGGGGGDRLSDVRTPARSVETPQSALDGCSRSLRLFHLQQQQSHHRPHQHTSPSSPSSVGEAAVAQRLRASSSVDALDNGGHDGAWRGSVEAELAELQRGGRLPVSGSAGAMMHETPISAVSPLSPASTTPYHQLLSHLRHSPSQLPANGLVSTNAASTGGAARANTPPDGQPLSSSSRLGCVAPTSLYTANITSIPRPSSSTTAVGAPMEQGRTCWPRSSLTPSEAAALWERLSPYEKAAVLLHTPDTVSKSVTLSSIAAHLHGGAGELGSPDETPGSQPQASDHRTHASPPMFSTAPTRVPRPASAAQLFPPSSSHPNLASSASGSTCVSLHHGWHRGHSSYRQEEHSHPAPPRTSATPAMALPPPPPTPPASAPPLATATAAGSAVAGSHKPQQQHSQTPSMRRWSPVDASPSTAGAGSVARAAHNTNSPPSCSLRPSPHPRPSNGSSPALRRYTIATPSGHATTATAVNNVSSSSKRGKSGSPLGAICTSATARGASREARPRVQLSQTPHVNGTGAAVGSSGRGARGSLSTSAHGGSGGTNPSTSSYHHNPSTHLGHHPSIPSTSAGATSGTGSSMVSAAAVQALIQRLQAAAPIVLPDSPSAAPGGGQLSSTADESRATGVTAVPSVASAPIILAMSHDQHGCRLLQAVIDAECNDGEALDEEHDDPASSGDAAVTAGQAGAKRYGSATVSPAMITIESTRDNKGNGGNGVGERCHRRRSEAFENSIPVRVVLRAIEPKLDAVMADGYGNFLLQKVFDMAPDAERQRLLRLPSLQHHLCEVACSPHGTFAVQRLVETVRNTEEERLVFVALERDLLRLLTNANGGHVLMKVMERIRRQYTALASGVNNAAEPSCTSTATPARTATMASGESGALPSRRLLEEQVEALFQAIQQHLLYVCQHKQGCCIVQKCMDFLHACAGLSSSSSAVASQMDYFERMAALLLPHVKELSTHPFGNYVVTRLVDVCYTRGSTATIDAVAAGMQRDLVRMCTNKFASNVIEHILRHCSERRIRLICQSLMSSALPSAPEMHSSSATASAAAATNAAIARLPLATVVMDPYGNYVVQTLLTVAPVDELVNTNAEGGGMLPVLQQLLPLLSSRNYGRKLETKTELALLRVEQHQQQKQKQKQKQRLSG